MYQCAQCKTTFSTLEMCVNHQCSMATEPTADSSQPQPQKQQQPQQQQQQAQSQQAQSQTQQAIVRDLQQLDSDNQGSSE